jgi:hypothetical protein
MVVLAGQVMDGAVLSFTVIVALQVDVLPQSSVALQIRVFTTGQVAACVVLTTLHRPLHHRHRGRCIAPNRSAGQAMVVLAGQVMAGAVLSFT